MRTRRFKVADVSGAFITVEGEEAVHALRVLRLKIGVQVVLFDGTGNEVRGVIRNAGHSQFEVEVLERRTETAGPQLIMAVATPKGERADWLVEKCAELGTTTLAWVRCARGEVVPGAGKIERWRRKADQAAKQARLATTMAVEAPRDISEVLQDLPTEARIWCATPDPAAATFDEALRAADSPNTRDLVDIIFVGPEGGFTEEEVTLIRQRGGQGVRLCRPILRVETAAIAAACLWAACMAARGTNDR